MQKQITAGASIITMMPWQPAPLAFYELGRIAALCMVAPCPDRQG